MTIGAEEAAAAAKPADKLEEGVLLLLLIAFSVPPPILNSCVGLALSTASATGATAALCPKKNFSRSFGDCEKTVGSL